MSILPRLGKVLDDGCVQSEEVGSTQAFSPPLLPDPGLQCKEGAQQIKMVHGTTTLAFKYKSGVVVAVDSRASAGAYIASQTVKKVIEINPFLLGTMAGGAADCSFWERYLGMRCRLFELEHKERISVSAASKLLANITYQYKGYGLSMGTMICGCGRREERWRGWVGEVRGGAGRRRKGRRKRGDGGAREGGVGRGGWGRRCEGEEGRGVCGGRERARGRGGVTAHAADTGSPSRRGTGPQIFYVDSDGQRLDGRLFSVGSGSTFAYGVLDTGYSYGLSTAEALELAERSIFAATYRDAYSGGTVRIYHIDADGWKRIRETDSMELYFKFKAEATAA